MYPTHLTVTKPAVVPGTGLALGRTVKAMTNFVSFANDMRAIEPLFRKQGMAKQFSLRTIVVCSSFVLGIIDVVAN